MVRMRGVLVGLLWIATVAGTSALVWAVISITGLRGGNSVLISPASADPDGNAVPGLWRGAAGRVSATCKGDDISIGTAVPQPGYTVDVHNRGPRQLELEFEPKGEGSDVYLVVRCVDGAPKFQHQ